MDDNSIILGIDPDLKMPAYCFMDSVGQVLKCGKITLEPLGGWAKIMIQAEAVGIEGQYAGARKNAGLKLSFCCGELAAVAKLMNKEPLIVSPKQWQARLLKVRITEKRAVIKRLSKAFAESILGEKLKDQDIADAVMVAEFTRQKFLNGLHGADQTDTQWRAS